MMTDQDKADTCRKDVEALLSDYRLLADREPLIPRDHPGIKQLVECNMYFFDRGVRTEFEQRHNNRPPTLPNPDELYDLAYKKYAKKEYEAAKEQREERATELCRRIEKRLVCVKMSLCQESELGSFSQFRHWDAKMTFDLYLHAAEMRKPSDLERVIKDLELIRAKLRRREKETGKHVTSDGLEDTLFFQKIAADIKKRPDLYRSAGKWLDDNFSNAAFEKSERDDYRKRVRKARAGRTPEATALMQELADKGGVEFVNLACEKAIELAEQKAREDTGLAKRQLASLQEKEKLGKLDSSLPKLTKHQRETADTQRKKLYRFYDEMKRLAEIVHGYYRSGLQVIDRDALARARPYPREFLLLRRFDEARNLYQERNPENPTDEESRRVLLMTWLLTDTDADKAGLGLTEFEKWPWHADGDRADTEDPADHRGRRSAKWFSLDLPEKSGQWMALAKRAWAKDLSRNDAQQGQAEEDRRAAKVEARLPRPEDVEADPAALVEGQGAGLTESPRTETPSVGIPKNIAELGTKITQATGNDRWNIICLVAEIGKALAYDHEITQGYRPCCWTLCGIDKGEFKNAENRFPAEKYKAFNVQYRKFKDSDVAVAIKRIVKPELDRRITSLRDSGGG